MMICISCSSFEVEPCENDVLANFLLIGEAVKRDKDLAKISEVSCLP